MTDASAALAPPPPPSAHSATRFHPRRLLIGVLILVVIGAAATLFGWDISGWFKNLWNTISSISVGYLIAAVVLITLETTATAYAWFSILRWAYPDAGVDWWQILACYAAAVGLNCVVPANLGTLTMLLMFDTIIIGATFAGVLGSLAVQKIFYTFIGTFVYVYLFATVSGAFDLQFGFISEHPVAFVIMLAGGAMLLVLVLGMLRARVEKWWAQAKTGGAIVVHPRALFARVILPEAISWLAMLAIIAVFLSAYHIPVDFHTVMRVVAGNSIANMTAVTPGGAGVVQGFNVISLKGVTSTANANAYSIAQQLVVTAWSLVMAIVLMAKAFGWSGGKALVAQSYSEAREKSAEHSDRRREKRHRRGGGGTPGEPTPTVSPPQP